MVITSAAPGSAPQVYLGASIVASAQAAFQTGCAQKASSNCQSGIASALNSGNALSIQARAVVLILALPVLLAALVAIIIEHNKLHGSLSQPQVVELQTDFVTSLADVQMSASVVFKTASNDPSPIIAALWPTPTDSAMITSTPFVG